MNHFNDDLVPPRPSLGEILLASLLVVGVALLLGTCFGIGNAWGLYVAGAR